MKQRNFLTGICLALFLYCAKAQHEDFHNTKSGLFAEHFSSGDGHGAFYGMGLNIEKGRRTWAAAALVQARSCQLSGMKMTHALRLMGERERTFDFFDFLFEMEVYNSIAFHSNIPLSASLVEYQKTLMAGDNYNLARLRYSTAEITGGVTIRIKLGEKIIARLSFGALVYHHLKYTYIPAHEQTGLVPQFAFSLCYNFRHSKINTDKIVCVK